MKKKRLKTIDNECSFVFKMTTVIVLLLKKETDKVNDILEHQIQNLEPKLPESN